MEWNGTLATGDSRYLIFRATNWTGTTTQYFQWLRRTGRLTPEEQGAINTLQTMPALGRKLDQGERVYDEALGNGLGEHPAVIDLRAKLDAAQALFTQVTQGTESANAFVRDELGVEMNAPLEGWEDWAIVLTGLALVAVGVALVVFFAPVAGALAAVTAAVGLVVAAAGAVVTIMGTGGATGAGGTAMGLGVLALAGLGLWLFAGSSGKRRRA